MDKMDASKQTFVVLAVQEYTQLKNKYDVHLKNIMEEERRRRRILMSSVLRSTQKLIAKTGTVGETASTPTSEPNVAAESIDIYLDSDMNMFKDPQKNTPFPGPLYQKEADPTTYYLNEDLTVMINMVEDEELNTKLESCQENNDAAPSTSPSLQPVTANESFSKEQTLFLIDIMRQHIERKGKGLPKSLEELIARLKSTRGTKKDLWKDAANKLTIHFMLSFSPERVARKWNTLVDAFKKIKDNHKTTGKGPVRFQFYSEMEALLGGKHDVATPVGSTSPSASPVQIIASESFSKDQTLFLIDFVRQHIESKGERLPKSLEELNALLKSQRGTKKDLWKDAADKLVSHFMQYFCPDKVARKWYTLVEAYKKVKDNNKTTGKGPIRFQFFTQMEALLGEQDDVVIPADGTSHATSPVQENDGLNKDQTLFLIDLMRQRIESKGERLPKSLEELNALLKSPRGTKKDLWRDAADKLASHFMLPFCPVKVARKWYTLIDAYKKIKESNKTRGKGTIRFQFYSEMDALFGEQHELKFPAVGASVGVEVRRPEALEDSRSISPKTLPTSESSPPCKRQKVDCELMQFLQDSEEASQRRHEETLAQLRSAQQGFEALMTKLLDKL
ncbi:uncharacterized protein LOC130418293 isoform X1 [Triplophysa dalaica]|uniref:uncharacterized protein LOC130418293 isoform X1 n=2 Tax=Triplophysa dalaica TaxID=1582913 RepID=UPI0024DF5143|nr:uncharacterized protein LOC130418293 isoform X1 [Triplophysa dalaica]